MANGLSPSSVPSPVPTAFSEVPLLLSVRDLGVADYETVYRQQRDWVERKKRRELAEDVLVLVEHPEVYTYGRKSKQPLLPAGIPSFSVERGGEVTYHNPGQLVAYPILELPPHERDLHRYLRKLEEVLIGTLRDFGLSAERRPGATGVWLADREKKIASIGVAVSSWVTYHGVALNVNNELSGFCRVSPCGFSGEVMTSLAAELGTASCPSMGQVKAAFLRNFESCFERKSEIA
jgi:lipoate-protein ligase B